VSDEMKKPQGENGTRGLIQAMLYLSVLVAYIFLEIQVTEE